ncbi:unnamed protein product, partial [Prorocentrum cordatum]
PFWLKSRLGTTAVVILSGRFARVMTEAALPPLRMVSPGLYRVSILLMSMFGALAEYEVAGGGSVAVNSGGTSFNSLATLDEDRQMLCYADDANGGTGSCRILLLSSGTIDFVGESHIVTDGPALHISVVTIPSSGLPLVCYVDVAGSSRTTCKVMSTSWPDSISVSVPYVLNSSAYMVADVTPFAVSTITDSDVALICRADEVGRGICAALRVEPDGGIAPASSFMDEWVFDSDHNCSDISLQAFPSSLDVFLLCWRADGDGTCTLLYLDDSTPSFTDIGIRPSVGVYASTASSPAAANYEGRVVVGITRNEGVVCYTDGVSTGGFQCTLLRYNTPEVGGDIVDPLVTDFVVVNTVVVNANPTSWIAGTLWVGDNESAAALVCYAIEEGVTCNILRTTWDGSSHVLIADSANLVNEDPVSSIALGSSGQVGDSVIICYYGEVSGQGECTDLGIVFGTIAETSTTTSLRSTTITLSTQSPAPLTSTSLTISAHTSTTILPMGTTTESATITGESTEFVTLADTAKAEDMAVMQFVSSNQSTLTVTIEGIEVTVVTADQDNVVDDCLFLPYVSNVTGVDIRLPTSLFDALGVESVLAVVAEVPPSAVPAGAGGSEVEGVISITLKSKVDGSTLSVTGLANPILIDLPNVSSGLVCGYFDEDAMEWTSEGVATTPLGTDGTLRCAVTHLTLFGAILKGFLSELECSQVTLLSAESYGELWTLDWSDSVGSVMLHAVLFMYLAMLLTAHACDVRDARAGCWGTADFVVPERVAGQVIDDEPMTPVVRDHAISAMSSGTSIGTDSANVTLTLRQQYTTRVRTTGTKRTHSSGRGTDVVTQSRAVVDAVNEGSRESCGATLQSVLLEVCTSLAQSAEGVQTAMEMSVPFTWGCLSGRVGLADVGEVLAAWSAKQLACASLLMHTEDLDFLLGPEVERELEAPPARRSR